MGGTMRSLVLSLLPLVLFAAALSCVAAMPLDGVANAPMSVAPQHGLSEEEFEEELKAMPSPSTGQREIRMEDGLKEQWDDGLGESKDIESNLPAAVNAAASKVNFLKQRLGDKEKEVNHMRWELYRAKQRRDFLIRKKLSNQLDSKP